MRAPRQVDELAQGGDVQGHGGGGQAGQAQQQTGAEQHGRYRQIHRHAHVHLLGQAVLNQQAAQPGGQHGQPRKEHEQRQAGLRQPPHIGFHILYHKDVEPVERRGDEE